ncbi:DinB family protein [Caldibacillus lycopersici]|uniref:DinB family protein n=1 Tax=Perspicuibacillus lycopersici TaxID=1325689 RepID=A0AAE3IRX4_9BACI|nr:DinB family protein [Perspicuibacillus lycopersici]MCU9613508.1 DinB family protein [Perspicuibacillus lycopersici]
MLKRHEVLFQQLTDYRQHLLSIVESITEEEADKIPPGFNNNIRWNLGHVYLDQLLWIQHITKEPLAIPDGFQEWFGYGTSPKDWQTPPPSLETLIRLLTEQPSRIKEQFGDRLEEEFAPTESGMYTIAQVLVRTIFHEGLHLQAILAIKRFI